MATTGDNNWKKHWQGSNHQSTVKKSCPYYERAITGFISVGTLSAGTSITYLDALTESHLKAAIQIPGKDSTYYVNIDSLVKPRSGAAAATPLSPSSFGLENQEYSSSTVYYNAIKNALNSRNDIGGELFDYLYELLDYAYSGAGDYTGIKLTGFPWGQLQNYYAEVIGPLACVRRGILSGIIETTSISNAKIYMPPDSEKLYDYKIIIGNAENLISAKTAKGVSNQVKPQFVTKITRESGKLGTLESTTEFRLLDILGTQTVVAGALYGWQLINPGQMPTDAIASILSVYRGETHNNKIPYPELLSSFINVHMTHKKSNPNSITVGEVRYKCEQLIQNWSKLSPQNNVLKKIFNIYLNESRVIYVKMDLNKTSGTALFSASAGGGSSLVRNLFLRSSNYATRTADRIGFQVS